MTTPTTIKITETLTAENFTKEVRSGRTEFRNVRIIGDVVIPIDVVIKGDFTLEGIAEGSIRIHGTVQGDVFLNGTFKRSLIVSGVIGRVLYFDGNLKGSLFLEGELGELYITGEVEEDLAIRGDLGDFSTKEGSIKGTMYCNDDLDLFKLANGLQIRCHANIPALRKRSKLLREIHANISNSGVHSQLEARTHSHS